MKSSEFSFLPLRETYWRGIILALSGAVIFFAVWCLSNGITTVFMHLFYFPIVLLAYHYRWKGCGLSTLLALVYLGLVAVFNSGQTEVIISAFYRFLVFVGIAAVIAAISERLVQVQDNLKNARQFEESVIANAYVWISVLAPDGTLLVWNDAAQAISGYKKADVVGKNTVWKQLYPDNAYRKKVTIEIERIIGRDTLLENFETEIRCADGSIKTIVWNTRSLRDLKGKVTGYIAIGRDITGPKRIEKKLSESEKLMRYIVKFDPNAIAVYDRDLHYIAVSDRYLQDYNVKEKDLIGKHHYEVFPEIPLKWKEVHQRCLAGAVEQNDDDFFERPDGSITYNRWKCIPWYQSDRSIGGIITYTEVTTERKRTEERLRESERKFRDIFNNINDAVHLHELAPDGRPGRFLDVNDAACRMLMVSRDELLAHSPLDYATEYHNPSPEKVTLELRTTGRATFETGHRRGDGMVVPVEINAHVITLKGKTVVLSVIRDLTYRKKAEEEIRFSNLILSTQQETSPDGILVVDENAKILNYNSSFVRIWKIPDDLIASLRDEPVLQFVVEQAEDPETFLARVRQHYEHREEKSHEEIQLKDGRVLERYSAPMLGEDNRYFGRVWYFRDITDRKRAEEALRESEERFRGITERISDLIIIVDPEGYTTFMSPSVTSILGFSPESFIGKRAGPDIIHAGDVAKIGEAVERLKNGSPGEHVEFRMPKSDGSYAVFDGMGIPVFSQGIYAGVQVVARDITERKRVEEALAQNERKFHTMADFTVDWEYWLAPDGNFVHISPSCEKITGYSPKEFIADPALITRIVHPDDTFLVSDHFNMIHKSPEPGVIDFRIVGKDGEAHWLAHSCLPVYDSSGTYLGRRASNRDISDRKRAEEKLHESEERYRSVIENAAEGIFVAQDGTLQYANSQLLDMIQTDSTGISGRPLTEFIHPDDRAFVFDRFQHRVPGENVPQHYDFRVVGTRGKVTWVQISAVRIEWNGRSATLNFLMDITDRKRAEEALRMSEEKYRLFTEKSNDIIYSMDPAGNFTYVSPQVSRYGYTPEEIISGGLSSLILAEDLPRVLEDTRITLSTGKPTASIFRVRDKSGAIVWLEDNDTGVYDSSGKVIAVFGIIRDITGRKRAEAALLESRQLFADIISFLPDPTFVIDRDGKVLAWNRALEKISGISAGDIVGKGGYEYSLWLYGKRRPLLIDLVLHPGQDAGRQLYNNLHNEGTTVTAQTEIARPGKPTISFSLVASPLIDPQGKIRGAIESMRDISRLREAEAELVRINQDLEKIVRERTRALEEEVVQRLRAEKDVQAALDYTRSVIEANPDVMIVLDRTGTVLDVNLAAELLAGIPRDQLIGTRYFRYLVEDGTHIDDFSRLLEHGRIEKIIQIPRNDGRITPLAVNATVIAGGTGTDLRIIVSGHDITRQKQDEEVIRASLEEKVILLREVHHRVKNNLQIIISLTNLQMRQTSDPEVKQILSETQNRVRAMSLVHEKLYRSESLSKIDFADYSRFLATQLFSYYRTDTQRVRLELAMSKIMVDINTAVPLGLLMNELISNALKHAFPHGKEGTISISGGEDHDRITLVVRDNGIGMPEEIDWRNTTSLGMRLITILIDQLNGTIDLAPGEGTIFNIQIQKNSADKAK